MSSTKSPNSFVVNRRGLSPVCNLARAHSVNASSPDTFYDLSCNTDVCCANMKRCQSVSS